MMSARIAKDIRGFTGTNSRWSRTRTLRTAFAGASLAGRVRRRTRAPSAARSSARQDCSRARDAACDGVRTAAGLWRYAARSAQRTLNEIQAMRSINPVGKSPGCRCSCSRRLRRRRSRRQAHGLHDHRQLLRRKGDVPAAPARGPVSVRGVGGARSARLARIGLQAGRALRPARHLRPFRRQHRVLFGSGRRERIPSGRGDGARVLQRILSRALLAIEGGLPVRVQHAQRRRRSRTHRPKSGGASSAPGTRRPTRGASRARWISCTAKAAATGCGGSSPTCR